MMETRDDLPNESGIPQPGDIIFFKPHRKRSSASDKFVKVAQAARGSRAHSEYVHAAIVVQGKGENCMISHFVSAGHLIEPLGATMYDSYQYTIMRPKNSQDAKSIIALAKDDIASAKYSKSKIITAYLQAKRTSPEVKDEEKVKEICSSYVMSIVSRALQDDKENQRDLLPQDLFVALDNNGAFNKVLMDQERERIHEYGIVNSNLQEKLESLKKRSGSGPFIFGKQKGALPQEKADKLKILDSALSYLRSNEDKYPYDNFKGILELVSKSETSDSAKQAITESVVQSAVKLKIITKDIAKEVQNGNTSALDFGNKFNPGG